MKRIQVLIYLLLSGFLSMAQSLEDLSFGTDSTFDVLTWNIEWFPKNAEKTPDLVSQIIEALDVDLLAIQEISDTIAFFDMVDGLDEYEGYLESSYFAGLAYIYKTSTVQVNDIYEIYTTSEYWKPFPRSPMVMDLMYMNERIFVINNHFKCCGDGYLDLNDSNDEEFRRVTASNLLKEYVDDFLKYDNTIVLGDLNDLLSDAEEHNVFQTILNDSEHYLFTDYDIAMGNFSDWSYPPWPSHLDHILINDKLFDEFENPASEIQTIKIEEHLPAGWVEYEAHVSDHRPVALKLMMSSDPTRTDPGETALYFSSYPNPFISETKFSFDVSNAQRRIEISNVQGQTVLSEEITPGTGTFLWSAEEHPEGVYFARMVSGNTQSAAIKLLLKK